jgi:hypothetical protein
MKTSIKILSLSALTALAGCGDDAKTSSVPTGSSGQAGEAGETSGQAGSGATSGGGSASSAGGAGEAGEAGEPTTPSGGTGTAGSVATGGTTTMMPGAAGETAVGGEGGAPQPEPQAYWECQASDQAFVRRAIQGVLGRRPYSQAEVNLYTDLIQEIDALDGVDPLALAAEPGKPLRHSRKVLLETLFKNPEYASNWEELYRDFMRVQRVDEYQNAACYGLRTHVDDAATVAAFVRDNQPDVAAQGTPATMADVIAGSLELDDVTPMYTANLFGMVVKTYAGANGIPKESELGRRRDFGAWFDAVYLNRDTVCLQCHNSEFSVTATADPATNRHYPVPALLEKALFGNSTGVSPMGEFEPVDRMHGALKFARFTSTCSVQATTGTTFQTALAAGLVTEDMCPDGYRLCTTASSLGPRDWICESTYQATRNVRPWNLAAACGTFTTPQAMPVDLAGVDTKFGNVTGLRSSMWDMHRSLRAGFDKLRAEGLGADPATWEVSDPDKAFAYLTVLNIVEKVWIEITGSRLTIQTYFPRNAAARDQLQHMADVFVASGYSNKALLEDIYASPYLNLAPPDSTCWESGYPLPRIFDPWVTAEPDPVKRNNSVGDAAVMLSARTAARSAYGALGWRLGAYGSTFPNTSGYGENSVTTSGVASGPVERQFQNETGFWNKNTEVGFRGFDFQARLGFEDRLGRCGKLAPNHLAKDVIDILVAKTKNPGAGTVRDLVEVLKDRIFGTTAIDETSEQPLLEVMLGASLDDDASTLATPDAKLRQVCGALITSPQALTTPLSVVAPDGDVVPKLTPNTDQYASLCSALEALTLPDGLAVTCNADEPLTVSVAPLP